ncbi:hypothetical protein SAMN02982929_00655 [Saccharopolyspora kobensis]|uniref:Uncharacterized protein n=1 Tax=Saccharopolyspora kobensis TaxID=146035 RepID=A0A1H5UUC6_9PSEU|nr:hypothetical protein [Saccharopolyspora kobensis]SEF78570.1 hypothetical protein SAMN02982929_00655 [Saccharopolyspora kobensis]
MALEWDELLIGAPGRRWRTASTTRRVLVIVHNVTAATRLLDVVPHWAGDLRIQTVFTCIGSSAFTTGTTDFLGERGITPIDWEQAVRGEFDLAVSASYGGALHEVRAPLIVLPHGMGYNKFLESRRIQENPGESRRIQENPGESRRIRSSVSPMRGCCTRAR